MPQGFHRHHRHGHGAVPYPAAQVADGFLSDRRQQEGHVGPSASPRAWRDLQGGLVHVPPDSRGHARGRWLHRLRPLGSGGKIVEADETYFGQVEERRPSKQRGKRPFTKGGRSGPGGKRAVVSLVERGGRVRSFHPAIADGLSVSAIVRENIAREAHLMTDESRLYTRVGGDFASHQTVTHSRGEYVRGIAHTNSVEGYFSIFKRGMRGTYQHCKEKHLHRYLAEFDFRYNHRTALGCGDIERTIAAVKGAEGKRLYYRQPHSA